MAKAKKTVEVSGDLTIHTENILPIIKKWLYSDHEIFLRELISNGFDAINKLGRIAVQESLENIETIGKIQIQTDEKAKTVTLSDNGLGMDVDEIQKYINQIAFSGAEEFVEKYKEKDEKSQIIGHFGLGFYSSYMVADLVEIRSLSYKKGAKSIRWSCDGGTHFSIKEGDRKEVGTDVILHLNKDNEAFLKADKLKSLVKKYANFLAVDIQVDGQTVNDQHPLWVKAPKDVKEQEYKDFYQKLYPMSPEPLFWIHLNVDFPFNLKGILYFPKLLHEMDAQKGQVSLYCQQVFITENAKDVLPEFLTLLQGSIDCPDFPLNVSRSYLQHDPYVQKITQHIIKKVADRLLSLFKKDREDFETYWQDIHPFIKFGMMHHDAFYDKVKDIVMFQSTGGSATTIPDYLDRNAEKSKDTVLYCTDKDAQASYLQLCKDQGLEVVYLDAMIDPHFIQFLESKDSTVKYKAVDSDLSDALVDDKKDAKVLDSDNKTAADHLVALFKASIGDDKMKVEAKHLKSSVIPALLLESEQAKRFKQMSAMMQGAGKLPAFDDFTLVLNMGSDTIKNIQKLKEKPEKKELVDQLCCQVVDLAKMSFQPLSGDEMQVFLKRSGDLLAKLGA